MEDFYRPQKQLPFKTVNFPHFSQVHLPMLIQNTTVSIGTYHKTNAIELTTKTEK